MYEVQTRQKSFCQFFFTRVRRADVTRPAIYISWDNNDNFFFSVSGFGSGPQPQDFLLYHCFGAVQKCPIPRRRYTRLLALFSFYTTRITTNICSLVVIKKILKLFFFVGQQKRTCLILAVLSSLKPWLKPFLVVDSFSFASLVSASY